MSMKYIKIIYFTAIILITPSFVFAESMRCGNAVISDSDTRPSRIEYLIEKCGQPYLKNGNKWYFNIGKGQFIRLVIVNREYVEKIIHGDTRSIVDPPFMQKAQKQQKQTPTNATVGYYTDAAVRQLIVKKSILAYKGNCPCPFSRASDGSLCGERSAYSRTGGYSPICYSSEITDEMVYEYRQQLENLESGTQSQAVDGRAQRTY